MMHTIMRHRLVVIGFALLIFIAGSGAYVYSRYVTSARTERAVGAEEVSARIKAMIRGCSDQGGGTECLKRAAADMFNAFSLASIFLVFEANEDVPEFFSLCHTAMHFLGQKAYAEDGDIGKTLSNGSGVCFAGFYHGALEAYLTDKEEDFAGNDYGSLSRIVPALCDVDALPARKAYHECLHGLGHALMYATDGELPDSLQLCDSIADQNDRTWCYSGAFMENSTSATNKDHPSRYLNADDPAYPCTVLEDRYLPMCYSLQTLYIGRTSGSDNVARMAAFCDEIPAGYRTYCAVAIGDWLVGNTQGDRHAGEQCALLRTLEYQDACIDGAVGATGQRYTDAPDRAIKFCATLSAPAHRIHCYEQISILLPNWVRDPNDRKAVCARMPDERTRALCGERAES